MNTLLDKPIALKLSVPESVAIQLTSMAKRHGISRNRLMMLAAYYLAAGLDNRSLLARRGFSSWLNDNLTLGTVRSYRRLYHEIKKQEGGQHD